MADIQTFKLKSGYDIPVLGLGTWQLLGNECTIIVSQAIEMGYRHIDTAELYDNEAEIGKALKSIDRDSIFITSKVTNTNLAKNDVLKACQKSLKNSIPTISTFISYTGQTITSLWTKLCRQCKRSSKKDSLEV